MGEKAGDIFRLSRFRNSVGWERAGEGQEASGVGWSSEAEDGAADASRGVGEVGDREKQHLHG